MKLGFVGLGKMGSAMAGNLLRAGHEVTVYNRTRTKAEALTAEGARVADTPAMAARGAEVVLTMLADDDALRLSVYGDGGVLEGLAAGAVHMSCSTISARLARELASGHTKLGHGYLSTPVFGRPEAAAAKKLLLIAAGEQQTIERCRPVFEGVSRQSFVVGAEPWQANVFKLCGNFMICSMMESFAEANATLRKAQVDPHLFLEAMNGLFGSPVYANYGSIIADEKFEPAGFALKLGFKDVRLALEAAQDLASPMPFASVLRDQFLAAIANGQGEADWASVSKVAARNAGL